MAHILVGEPVSTSPEHALLNETGLRVTKPFDQ
jgi:hypothetical protein